MAARGGEGQRYNVIPTKVVQDLTQAYSFALPFLTVMYPEQRHLLPSPVNMFDKHSIVDLANSLLGFTEDFRKMYPSIVDVLSKVPQEAVFGPTSTFILSAAANGPDAFLRAMWEKYDELNGQTVGSLRGGGNGEDPTADLMTNLFGKRPRSRSRSVQKGGAHVGQCYKKVDTGDVYKLISQTAAASSAGGFTFTAKNQSKPELPNLNILEGELLNAALYTGVPCLPGTNMVASGAAAALTPADKINALDSILESLPEEGTTIPPGIKERCIAAGMPKKLLDNIADKKTLIAAITKAAERLELVAGARFAAAEESAGISSAMTAAVTIRGLKASDPRSIIADVNSQFAKRNFPPGESPFSSLFTAGNPRYSSPFVLLLHVLFFISFSCKILDTVGFVRGLAPTNAPFNAFIVDGPDGPTLMMGKYLPAKGLWPGAEITFPSLRIEEYYPDTVNLLSKSAAAKAAISDEKEKQALIGAARVSARKDAKEAQVFSWYIAGYPEKPLNATVEIKTTTSSPPLPEGCTLIRNFTSDFNYPQVEYRTPIQQKYFEMFIAVEAEIKGGDMDVIVERRSEREKAAGSWIPIEMVQPYTEMIPLDPTVASLYHSLETSAPAPEPDPWYATVYGPMLRVFEDAMRLIPERSGVSPTETLRRELYKVFQTNPGAFATIRGPGITPELFVDTPYFSSGQLISWYGMPYPDPLAGRATSLTLTAQCFYNGYASSNIIMPMLGSLGLLAAGVAIPIPGMFRISLYAAAGLMSASTIGTYHNCASSLFVLALETFKTSLAMSILLLIQAGLVIGTRAYWGQLRIAMERRDRLLLVAGVESSVHETAKSYADGIVHNMLQGYEEKKAANSDTFTEEIGVVISETLIANPEIFNIDEIKLIEAITAAARDAPLSDKILKGIYKTLKFTTVYGDKIINSIIAKAERKIMDDHLKSVIGQVIDFLDRYKLSSETKIKQLVNLGGTASPEVSAIMKASAPVARLTALAESTESTLGVFQAKRETPVEFIANAIEGLMRGNLAEMRAVVTQLKETPGGSSDAALKEMLQTAALSISALKNEGSNTAAVAQLVIRHMYTSVATRIDNVTEGIFANLLSTTASAPPAAAAGGAAAAGPAAIANARRNGPPTAAAAVAGTGLVITPPAAPPAAAPPANAAARNAAAVAAVARNAERLAAEQQAANAERRRVAEQQAANAERVAANARARNAANAEKRREAEVAAQEAAQRAAGNAAAAEAPAAVEQVAPRGNGNNPEGGYRRGKGLKAFKAFKGRNTHHRSSSRLAPRKQTRKHKKGRHTRKIRKLLKRTA